MDRKRTNKTQTRPLWVLLSNGLPYHVIKQTVSIPDDKLSCFRLSNFRVERFCLKCLKNWKLGCFVNASLWFLTNRMDQTFSSATMQSDSISRHLDSLRHLSRIRTASVPSSSKDPGLKKNEASGVDKGPFTLIPFTMTFNNTSLIFGRVEILLSLFLNQSFSTEKLCFKWDLW